MAGLTDVFTPNSKNSVTIFVLPLMLMAEDEAEEDAVLAFVRCRVACMLSWVSCCNGVQADGERDEVE